LIFFGVRRVLLGKLREGIHRHWAGDFPLLLSFLVVGGFALIFMRGVPRVLGLMAMPFRGGGLVEGYVSFALLSIYSAVLLLVFVWWLVGAWRSATNLRLRKHSFAWPYLTKLMISLIVLLMVAVYMIYIRALFMEAVSNIEEDPQWGARWVKLGANAKEIEVHGYITRSMVRDFKRIVASTPGISTVKLDSEGGRVGPAQRMRDDIRARGLNTFVTRECDSACTVVFLGGKSRWMTPSARLGFHAARAGSYIDNVTSEELRNDGISAGVSRAFMVKAYAGGKLWYPTVGELKSANVVTNVVSPTSHPEIGTGIK
jgi:hypothetical protein